LTQQVQVTSRAAVRRPILINVQILRFIAAASVLTKHSVEVFFPQGATILRLPLNGGVDLFFVISGFIMAWLTQGQFGKPHVAARFLLRRAIRIVPPYWFFTSLMIVLLLVAPNVARNTRLGWTEVVTSFAFIPWPRPADGVVVPLLSPGWTLNYEMFFYLCFGAALLLRRGKSLLIGLFLGLAAAGMWLEPGNYLVAFYANPIILEFLAGIALERLYSAGVRASLMHALLLIVAGALAYLVLGQTPLREIRGIAQGIPAALVAAAFILGRAPVRARRVWTMLQAGGDASYTLYLSHPFTINGMYLLWTGMVGSQPTVGMFIAMGAAISFSLIFYHFAERPFTAYFQSRAGLGSPRSVEMVAP
jgi:peptidoglycan/LPS O-acetylase OafA/YrhL